MIIVVSSAALLVDRFVVVVVVDEEEEDIYVNTGDLLVSSHGGVISFLPLEWTLRKKEIKKTFKKVKRTTREEMSMFSFLIKKSNREKESKEETRDYEMLM